MFSSSRDNHAAPIMLCGMLAVLAWSLAAPAPAAAAAMAIDCDASAAGTQASCSRASGASFSIQLRATSAPSGGYVGFQTKLNWTAANLEYLPKAKPADEIEWPDSAFPLRSPASGSPSPPVAHASASGVIPPLPVSHYEGTLVQLQFRCRADGSSQLSLISVDSDPLGSGFASPSGGTTTPSLTGATVGCGVDDNPPGATTPSISALKLAPPSFNAAASGASVAAKGKKKTGSIASYKLSADATVKFTAQRAQKGRRSGGKCVKARKRARGKRCTRYKAVRGSFSVAGIAGSNKFKFTGRISKRKLRKGKYLLSATPSAGGKTGKTATARFRIK